MGKYRRGSNFEMLDLIVKIAGMVVTLFSTIVKAIELAYKLKHQKSNRPDQS
ncbi:MAG: hypothetical protein K2K70_07025 [Lachnospiraceae bacterium]|nr:hypothetical protein [Lachnospiraceae bacterium]